MHTSAVAILRISVVFEHSVGSVWLVCAIGLAYFLWHAQTIRFLQNVRTQLKSTLARRVMR